MPEKLLTYRDVSARWQKPVSTLRALVMKKKLKPIKLGRDVRFALKYIEEIEAQGGF
jgi:hypothetical protein